MLFYAHNNSFYDFQMKNFIKEIREDRGLTTAQLAKDVGTSQQQISKLENTKQSLKWEWVVRLSSALQCHPLDIVEGPAVPKAPAEREVLEKYRVLEEPAKRMVYKVMDAARSEMPQENPKKKG